jgi:hypothetical protein
MAAEESSRPPKSPAMPDTPDPARLLTALTTEHFTLQGARAATTGESAARSSLFLGSVTCSTAVPSIASATTTSSLPGRGSRMFMMGANDDARGVLRNMGLEPNPVQLYLTNSFAIAVVTAVLVGSVIALALGVATGAALGIAVAAGGVAAIVALVALMRVTRRMYGMSPALGDPLFPSP